MSPPLSGIAARSRTSPACFIRFASARNVVRDCQLYSSNQDCRRARTPRITARWQRVCSYGEGRGFRDTLHHPLPEPANFPSGQQLHQALRSLPVPDSSVLQLLRCPVCAFQHSALGILSPSVLSVSCERWQSPLGH